MTEAEAREGLTEMYQEKYDDLVRMYKSRAGANDVEDLVQEGFYRALYYIKSFNPKLVSMDRWLSGVLENCLRDLLNEKRGGSSLHNKLEEDSAIYDMPIEATGIKELIVKEIGKMSGRTKDALYFYFMMGYEPGVIDRIVGLSSTRERVYEFKEKLRSLYPGYLETT